MSQKDTSPISQAPPARPPQRRRRIVIVFVGLAILLLVAVLLYNQRMTIFSTITGSRFVEGKAQPAAITLPPGFSAEIFSSGLKSPRMIAFSPDGTLFVAERGTGSIIALPQQSGGQKKVVVSGLNDPTSFDFHQGKLYVGEESQISRFTLGADLQATGKQVIVPDIATTGHNTRTVLIGADGKLYVSIGSSCNNCEESDPHRASVWIYNDDGSSGRVYARGLRNAVGMALNPWNQQIWVTNNGRDLLGDDTPPETVYALQDGGDYGWPRCHAGNLPDPDLGKGPDACTGVIAPLVNMQAHSAPLGLTFYNAQQFPPQFRGLFVAFHGSWNRSVPTGYKVVFVPLNEKGEVTGPVQDFATGWLQSTNEATGRPVGLTVGPDGALYVSDDKAGMIYKITYKQ